MNESDDALLERIRAGGEAGEGAFEQLFVRHYSQVYRALYSLLGGREGAEDLAQDTFLELYRHTPVLHGDATLIAWLCRVALNKGYNALRSDRRAIQRMERLTFEASSSSDDPYLEVERTEERALVREVLARLPERQSKLLLLRQSGLSLAEIAPMIEVAPGSVGTLLARAERAFANAYDLMKRIEPENSSGSTLEKRNQ